MFKPLNLNLLTYAIFNETINANRQSLKSAVKYRTWLRKHQGHRLNAKNPISHDVALGWLIPPSGDVLVSFIYFLWDVVP